MTKKKNKKPYAHSKHRVCIILALCLSQTAWASDSFNSLFDMSIAELMDLKVSVASLFEESELDVASSVSVVTKEEWQRRGARRTGDALESIPSISTYPTWAGAEAIAIRGYATELSVRGIASTLNGVPLNTYIFASSSYDKPIINLGLLDRIEVIRGPGSTLYGTDAFHGVLSYQTQTSSSNRKEGRVKVGKPSYSSGSYFQSQRLGETRINAGIAFQSQGRQGLQYQYTSPYSALEETGERDYSYQDLSTNIALEYGEKDLGLWRVNVYANTFASKDAAGIGSQFFHRLPTVFDLENPNINMDRDHMDQDSNFVMTKLEFEKNLDPHREISAQLYHWNSDKEWFFDNSRYPNSLTVPPTPTRNFALTLPCLTGPSATNPNPLYCSHEMRQLDKEDRAGFQTQIKSVENAYNTKWVAGLGAYRQRILDSTFRRVAPDETKYVEDFNPYHHDRRYVRFAFAQGSTTFADKWLNLIYGVRWDDYSDVGSHTSPRIGLVANISENYTSKLLYGHAFRAPSALERKGNYDAIQANPDIKPEEINTIEWVNIFHHEDYQAQVTLFTSDWKEGIVLVTVSGADGQYRNTGENRSYGLELQALKKIGQWNLQASASYVRSENSESKQEYGAFPRWLGNIQAWYSLPAYRLELGINERIMLHYDHSDSINLAEGRPARDYYRTDLSLKHNLESKTDDEYALSLTVRNIFNRDNVLSSVYNTENALADLERQIEFGVHWQY